MRRSRIIRTLAALGAANGTALASNGKVVSTGSIGADAATVRLLNS